jgi:putative transposase
VLICTPQRAAGKATLAFDWGIETFAHIATEGEEPQTIDNPRWLKSQEERLKSAYHARDRKRTFSHDWRLANKRVVQLHAKIARQRLDFHHQISAKLVGQAGAIFTEALAVANMTKRPKAKLDTTTGQYQPNGAAAKAGLNKAILDGAPARFLSIVKYKAAEAGLIFAEAPTRTLKPSQRCHQCWEVQRKRLSDRWHRCPCGASCHRDLNAALVALRWGIEHTLSVFFSLKAVKLWGQELAPGIGPQNFQLDLFG